ncbi:hypothetical protein QJQ45_011935 [Haematococcus lacustris]|nr:hypothetical protein QJQ45_011935 [Haematococcus lacustris]
MTNPNLTGHHARWALSLQDYTFTIEHRPGNKHQNADVLSRWPLATTADGSGAQLDPDPAVALACFPCVATTQAESMVWSCASYWPFDSHYATTHSGSYKPAARQLHPGSFVWTQRPQANTLQLGARPEIYRVVSVGANGVARLMGKCGRVMAENVCNLAPCHLPDIDPTIDHTLARPTADFPCSICKSPTDADRMLLCDGCGCGYHMFCLTPKLTFVPEGIWLCADCTNRGTTALEVQRRTQAVATQPAATPLHEVFTTKPGRDRAAAAQRLHGRVVRHTGTGLWGVLRFKGQQFHPRFFAVDWVDGTITDAMSPTILRNRQWLQPEGTTLPAAPPHGVQPSRRRSTRLGPSGDNAVLATMATVSTGLISMASLWA